MYHPIPARGRIASPPILLNVHVSVFQAAVETYEAITEIADVNHLFLLAEPLYVRVLYHAVFVHMAHAVAYSVSSHS